MKMEYPCLVGRLLSPYVRRIAVTLNLYNMPFERLIISAIDDEAIREKINPVGRVPALVLSETETIVDSIAILDHLDELAGADALTPKSGLARRQTLHQLALAPARLIAQWVQTQNADANHRMTIG